MCESRRVSRTWFGMAKPSVDQPDWEKINAMIEMNEADEHKVIGIEYERDLVNNPPHYDFIEGYEVKDIIEVAVKKNMSEATHVQASMYWQVLKYLLRCGCKDAMLTDAKKAQFYLKDLIARLEETR